MADEPDVEHRPFSAVPRAPCYARLRLSADERIDFLLLIFFFFFFRRALAHWSLYASEGTCS